MARSRARRAARAVVEETERGIAIVFRPRRQWGGTAFLCVWLCGWLLGEAFATAMAAKMVSEILRGNGLKVALPAVFILAWLSVWTFAGVKTIGEVVKNLLSAERIEIDSERVRVYKRGLFSARFVEYPTYLVKNFRSGVREVLEAAGKRRRRASKGTLLTFEADGEPMALGPELTEAQARAILKDLAGRYPYLVGTDEDANMRRADQQEYEEA